MPLGPGAKAAADAAQTEPPVEMPAPVEEEPTPDEGWALDTNTEESTDE